MSTRLLARSLFVVGILGSLFGLPALAAANGKPSKLDARLQRAVESGEGGPVEVIVRATPRGRGALQRKLESKGHQIKSEHGAIDAYSVSVDASELAELADDPSVESVSIDATVDAHQTVSTNLTLDVVAATVGSAPTGFTGKDIGVALIDSGIANVPDLHDQTTVFYDFTQGGKKVGAFDDFGHGTHVAATICSSGKQNSKAFQGVAPAVRLIGLKVLDASGKGRTSDVINAVLFATANKAQLGIDVINLSLGHPIYESAATDPLVRAVEQAVAAGIVVVASAGNAGTNPQTGQIGYGGITSPGNAPSAITVGAVRTFGTVLRSDDAVAAYSSRGPSWYDGFAKPDLVAPGDRLVADVGSGTLYQQYPLLRVAPLLGWTGTYMRLSGSSMATGVATGVVALVLEANRSTKESNGSPMAPLNPYGVKAILQYTATAVAGADALTQGAGEINAAGAVALTQALDTTTTPWHVASLSETTLIGGQVQLWSTKVVWGSGFLQSSAADNVVWGSNELWDDNIVWGSNLVWGNNIVWGDNIVWGNNIVWGDNVVWGSNIVWSNNIVWGDNVVWGDNIVWGDSTVVRMLAIAGQGGL
jgi:serine protease AprX